MRVLFLSSDNNRSSGAFLSMVALNYTLNRSYGVNTEIILPNKGNGESLLDENKIKHTFIKSFDWIVSINTERTIKFKFDKLTETIWNLCAAIKIAKYIKDGNFEIVHSNTTYTYVGALAAKLAKRPIVWHLREFLEEDQGRTIWCKKYGYKLINKANRIIVISKKLFNKYSSIFGNRKLKLIYNGIDSNIFLKNEKIIFKSESNIFIFVGGLAKNKGCFDLIEALSKVKKAGYDNFEIWFIGNITREFLSILKNSIIFNQSKCLGYVKNTFDYYQNADIAFTCSKSEAFGRITVEAMMSGNLIIASNGGATLEFVENGKTGLLYEQGNIDSLAENIIYALNHKEEMKSIAAAGRLYASENLTANINAQHIFGIYSELLQQYKRPSLISETLSGVWINIIYFLISILVFFGRNIYTLGMNGQRTWNCYRKNGLIFTVKLINAYLKGQIK